MVRRRRWSTPSGTRRTRTARCASSCTTPPCRTPRRAPHRSQRRRCSKSRRIGPARSRTSPRSADHVAKCAKIISAKFAKMCRKKGVQGGAEVFQFGKCCKIRFDDVNSAENKPPRVLGNGESKWQCPWSEGALSGAPCPLGGLLPLQSSVLFLHA